MESSTPSLAITVSILITGTQAVILLYGSYLTALTVWALISPSVAWILMMCSGWEVGWCPSQALYQGWCPFIHSLTWCSWLWGHRAEGVPIQSGRQCQEGKSWEWGTSASKPCQQGPDPGSTLCWGILGNPVSPPPPPPPALSHPGVIPVLRIHYPLQQAGLLPLLPPSIWLACIHFCRCWGDIGHCGHPRSGALWHLGVY